MSYISAIIDDTWTT